MIRKSKNNEDKPDFEKMWSEVEEHKQQEALWQKQGYRLTDIVRNNEGVWISTKVFYIIGSLSLLSIITIVMEIVFYVYFRWIQ